MKSPRGILSSLSRTLKSVLATSIRTSRTSPESRRPDARSGREPQNIELRPRSRTGTETRRVDPTRIRSLRISYSPELDGAPDAGEIVWTWVPYEENDGRGKDRPVLVIARESSDRVYAVRTTTRPHDGDQDHVSIGSGSWDSQRRESWVDIGQLYSVHEEGLRREAAALDRPRFDRVAEALAARYGWTR